jgi:BlaI family penicillinase repressor
MAISLGTVQLKIMRILWDEGESTARRITERMNSEQPTALSTVQTLLRQLQAKKAVAHEKRDRTFYFRALVQESEVERSAANDLLGRVFQGSISGLVAHLLENEDVSEEELARLRKLIEEKEQGGRS